MTASKLITSSLSTSETTKIENFLTRIKNKITTEFAKNKTWIIGVSGGVDSAVCLAILCRLIPKQQIQAFHICFEQQNKETELSALENHLGIEIQRVINKRVLPAIAEFTGETRRQFTNNWQPKLRALFLYDKALSNNGIVVSCLNYSEAYLGYFTKYGDSQGDFFPISGLLKQQVYKLARYFQLPSLIVNQPPSPGFLSDQETEITDEAELGVSYDQIDRFLQGEKIQPESEKIIQQWHEKNKHKWTTISCLPREDF